MSSILAASGEQIFLPSWGRSFWQDSVTGDMICLYASGANEVDYVTSSDSGVTWSSPSFAFPVDDFTTHNNFDTSMDRDGNVHCVHRYNGSGCYTVLGKNGSGAWAASGVVARGFFTCRSTVDARDFNGSVEVYDTTLRAFGDPTSPPSARIVAVDTSNNVKAWYVDSPFTGFPVFESTVSTRNVGASGGFPIPVGGLGSLGALAAVFSVDATGISMTDVTGFEASAIDILPNVAETGKEGGLIGDAPLSYSMAWDRPFIGNLAPVLVSTKDVGKFEFYTGTSEPFGNGNGFYRVDSTAPYFFGPVPPTDRRLNLDNIPFKDLHEATAGAPNLINGGSPVGMSHFDEDATIHMYFVNPRSDGNQTIYRVKANGQATPSTTKWYVSELNDVASGLISWPDVTLATAGAGTAESGNFVHWHGFKPIKHPTIAGSGTDKQEIVATVGSGITNGSGDVNTRLYMWRFEDSIAGQGLIPLPTFSIELTADSGNRFVGIASSSGISSPSVLFDGSTSTGQVISNSGNITLEFDDVYSFSRIEFPISSSGAGTYYDLKVESSLDGANFTTVYNIENLTTTNGDSLIKLSSELDVPADATVTQSISAFAGKYVRITFDTPPPLQSPANTREIRLYGIDTTAGYTQTEGFSKFFFSNEGTFRTENFASVPIGGIPTEWSTYGDFEWSVDRGVHSSGAFSGEAIGSGDLSAIRTNRNPPANSSGVLELYVEVTSPRTITFDMKWDAQANVGVIDPSQPTDDYIELFVITPTGTVDKAQDLYNGLFVTPSNYRTVSFDVNEPGLNTIRIIYNRGNIEVGSGNVGGEGAMWIDNFANLDPKQSDPNILTSIYGYMDGALSESGMSYAYVSGVGHVSGNALAYMSGAANVPSGVTNAFLLSDTMESGMVYAYLPSVQASEQVYAFMEGSIDVAMDVVGAYIFTSGVEGSVLGYMKNAATGCIYGYLKAPSGAFDSVYAYTLTPEFTNVYGYLKGPIPHGGVAYGYLEGIDYDNHIYGYMHASGLNTSSYGYINAEGITGNIYAYMPNGEKINVAGYIKGADVASGVINAWTSGVGVESGVTYAYIPGISGVATGVFYGYMSAVNLPSGQVYGHLIGFDDGAGCNFPVPLPSSVAVPTGNFFT